MGGALAHAHHAHEVQNAQTFNDPNQPSRKMQPAGGGQGQLPPVVGEKRRRSIRRYGPELREARKPRPALELALAEILALSMQVLPRAFC